MVRTGRPKSQSPRVKMVNVRLSEQEYAILVRAAAAGGVSVSQYVRDEALLAARGFTSD